MFVPSAKVVLATPYGIVHVMDLILFFCNKKVMKSYRHPGVLGTKADVLAMNVDRLLNGSEDFGIGKVRLLNNDVYKPNNNYYGRCITYEVMAFNRKMGGAK